MLLCSGFCGKEASYYHPFLECYFFGCIWSSILKWLGFLIFFQMMLVCMPYNFLGLISSEKNVGGN